MDLNTLKSWKYFGISAGFHTLIGTLALVGLNGALSPKSEFSNAIVVDLVVAGEHEKTSPMEPEAAGMKNIPAFSPPMEPENSEVPEPEGEEISEIPVQNMDPPPQPRATHEVEVSKVEEETAVDVLVLAKIPRTALAGLLSDGAPPREGRDQGPDQTGARASDRNSEEFRHFLSEIRDRLEKAKRYPFLARLRGQEGIVQIAFRINPSGKPEGVYLVQPSEWPILNREAVKTVRRAVQFGFPPEGWKGEVEVKVPLAFKLEDP